MFRHHDKLIELAHEQERLVAKLTSSLISQDMKMAALDLSAITANTTEISRVAAAAAAGDSAAIQEAVAAQLETDQAAVNEAGAAQASALAPLSAEFPPAASVPTALTISPATVPIPVGSTATVSLSITGGEGPYTETGLPSGVTLVGATLDPDGTQAAGGSTVTITDINGLVGTVSITVA